MKWKKKELSVSWRNDRRRGRARNGIRSRSGRLHRSAPARPIEQGEGHCRPPLDPRESERGRESRGALAQLRRADLPGRGWTLPNTKRTVVQISKKRGRRTCSAARRPLACAVVQISKSFADDTTVMHQDNQRERRCRRDHPAERQRSERGVVATGYREAAWGWHRRCCTHGVDYARPGVSHRLEQHKPCLASTAVPIFVDGSTQQHEGGERDGHDRGSSVGRGQPDTRAQATTPSGTR